MRKRFYSFVLMAVGLLIGTNAWAERTLVATMTALEQTTSFYWEEGATGQDNVYASAYYALTAALAALPENSTPATVKLFSDVALIYDNTYFEVPKNHNVTIDLNGNNIYAETSVTSNTRLISNKGTLTIEDNSLDKLGIVTNMAFGSDKTPVPGRGSYVIQNYGTLILNSGTIESLSQGGATYCVENHKANEEDWHPHFIMNGGKLKSEATAVRLFIQNPRSIEQTNTVEIKGGEIEAKSFGIDIQSHTHGDHTKDIWPKLTVNISGGIINSGGASVRSMVMDTKNQHLDVISINVSGGTLSGGISVGNTYNSAEPIGKEDVSISGGVFMGNTYFSSNNPTGTQYTEFITGGIFCNLNNKMTYKYHCDSKIIEGITKDVVETARKNLTVEDLGDKWKISYREGDLEVFNDDNTFNKSEFETPDKLKAFLSSDERVVVDYADYTSYTRGKYWAICTVIEEKYVYNDLKENNDIYIATGFHAQEYYGNGHPETDLIISTTSNKETNNSGSWATPETWSPVNVPDAATDVTVKNEIVIESGTAVAHGMEINDEGQIVVKKGAVLEIGAAGIKTNNHTIQPIIVEAGGTLRVGVGGVSNEAGTLNPVEIYNDGTNSGAFMINPNAQVNTMPEATITLTTNVRKGYWQHLALPIENLTEHSNDKGAANAVFEWKNNDWNQLGGWNEIKAFKGYDFTNNYEGEGKVTYTFKGQLIGVQNQGLSLIEGVNFFGNSYTAPISLRALFDQIDSDMESNTIEKTVYI